MSPSLATALCAAAIAWLFALNRERDARTSRALWIPTAWVFIGASRMVSQWIAGELPVKELDLYLEGSPLDRIFFSAMLGAALLVLAARGSRTGPWLRANLPIVVFFLYCALSVLWSDYAFVAFKRWIKAFGNVVMVMVVMTDPDPPAAVRRLLARAGFLLIPLSVLLIKYYPALGRLYNRWTWTTSSIGVSTDKNGLGALCLVFGLASLWRFLATWRDDTIPRDDRRRRCLAHGAILAMVLWLFAAADSSTSLACFLLGATVLVITTLPGNRPPAKVNVIAAAIVIAPLVAGLLFQSVYALVVHGLGRSTTLTGRTDIWSDIFGMSLNPWLGTGFESFWLGSRAEYFWSKYDFHPNQAHNGYLETYINLGVFGLGLLGLVVASGYRNIVSLYQRDTVTGSLRFAFLIVALVYNITEAAFKVTHPLWIVFLLAAAAVPTPPLPRRVRPVVPARRPFAAPPAPAGAAAHLPRAEPDPA